jgi:hypothetical protein
MTTTRVPKNQFKCYHCRNLFAQREGDWFHWGNMQVHLCLSCSAATKGRPERSLDSKSG